MTKKFSIGEPTVSTHIPNTFEVEIRTMSGDADAWDTVTVGSFRPDEAEALTSLIETLDRMKAKYPHGRGGSWPDYGFQDVEGFYSWFGDMPDSTEEEYHQSYEESHVPYEDFLKHRVLAGDAAGTWWPYEVTGGEVEQDMESYKVFYYDKNLVQYKVEITE